MTRNENLINDPIAIVGASCRLPGGVASLQDYWILLRNGCDAVGEIGPERFATERFLHPVPGTPGRTYTWAAGLVDQVDHFDPGFFGISPREATQMDPQHRLLLELAWEALELSGQRPSLLSGSNCGVFVGISATDYLQLGFDDPASGNAYTMSGNTLSTAANRISHFLNLRGPSMAIDTACSSSLVALHVACQSLWNGDCDSVLVGGMHLLLSPLPFVGFSSARMLSPTGRSRAFDARADGYVRGEGGGVVYLKPLANARADGDVVLATILATGTNSVGSGPAISVPSADSQSSLLQGVYANAGISPNDVSYVEAHGTGTAVGDPIEANAIGKALGMTRSTDSPLLVGSVKSNIGHLEPASGIAGLLKVVLCLQHEALPPSLHFEQPNPGIDFGALNLRVVESYTELVARPKPYVMGVSSFGFGGVNAHVVVSQAAGEKAPETNSTQAAPLILSAHNAESLSAIATRYADLLESGEAGLYDIAWSAATRRDRFAERLIVDANDAQQAAEALRNFTANKRDSAIVAGRAVTPSKVAMVFNGNGSQWSGMGCALLEESESFAAAVERVQKSLSRHSDLTLADALTISEMHRTEIAQPALFAVQIGLFELLSNMGVRPNLVLGHSVGEVAAAYAAGIFNLDQAVDVIHARSTTQAPTRGGGRMAALRLGAQAASKFVRAISPSLEVAAVNSANSVTIAGPQTAVEKLHSRAAEMDIGCAVLQLEYAFHSDAMKSVEEPLLAALDRLSPSNETIPFISTVTGESIDGTQLDANYWWRNVREPVAFFDAMSQAIEKGVRLFVEIGPRPILGGYVTELLRSRGQRGLHIPTLNSNSSGIGAVREVAFKMVAGGADPALETLFAHPGQHTRLPTYAWQRRSFWRESTVESREFLTRMPVHPILGVANTDTDNVWEFDVDEALFPWLGDHRINGTVVFPGSAFIEIALAASAVSGGWSRHRLRRFMIRAPMVLAPGDIRTVRVTIDADDGRLLIASRRRLSDEKWTLHVQTRVLQPNSQEPDRRRSRASRPYTAAPSPVSSQTHYLRTTAVGLEYGPIFQTVKQVDAEPGHVDCTLEVSPDWSSPHQHGAFVLAPPLLDGAFQTLVHCGDRGTKPPRGAFVPISVEEVDVHIAGVRAVRCELTVTGLTPRTILTDIALLSIDGQLIAELTGCRFHAFGQTNDLGDELPTYRLEWKAANDAADVERRDQLSVDRLIRLVRQAFTATATEAEREQFHKDVLPLLAAIDAGFVLRTIRALLNTGDDSIVADELERRHALGTFGRELLDQLLEWLDEAELVDATEAGLTLRSLREFDDVGQIWRLAATHYPEHVAELAIAAQVGQSLEQNVGLADDELAREIRGPSAAVGRLLPGLRNTRVAQGAGESLLAAVIASWPQDRRLRILDCGGAAEWFCSRLADSRGPNVDWTLCTLNSAYRERMRRLAGEHGLTCFEGSPAEWPATAKFDIVLVGCQILKAEDLDTLVSKIGRQLAPGGALAVCTQWAQPLPTMVWRAQSNRDDADQPSRIHTAEKWVTACANAGFDDVEFIDEVDGSRGAQVVIANRADYAEFDDRGDQWAKPDAVDEMGARATARIVVLPAPGALAGGIADELHGALDAAGATSVESLRWSDDLSATHCLIKNELRLVSDCGQVSEHETIILYISDNPSALNLDSGADGCNETKRLLAIQQALAGTSDRSPISLYLVTPAQSKNPMAGALAGLSRVIRNEHPHISTHLITYETSMGRTFIVQHVLAEIVRGASDLEVLLKPDARFVRSLRKQQNSDVLQRASKGADLCLNPPLSGGLRALQWQRCVTPEPASGEVVVAANAVGLNFRDVMFAMGLLPEEILEGGLAGPTLGLECAGEVVAIGADVVGLEVGDRVVCFAAKCFATRVVARANACFRIPMDWTFSAAATVTTTFFTSLYALEHLARLERGERILIHGASGGVGMAAMQVARYIGAEVIATAGSEEKRAVLKLLGASHVFDSRSLNFASEVLAATNGEGVDVVMNCIAGEALRRGLDILRPFGRFLELGKRDFVEDTRVGLRPFRHNITYFGIDADQVMLLRPKLAAQLLERLQSLFASAELSPLPYREFSARAVAEAFAYMQQSAHLGKIVVRLDDLHERVERANSNPALGIHGDDTYLITGGTRGFGMATARWLFEQGARHIVLVGRNGLPGEEERIAVETLRQRGAQITVIRADVSDLKNVEALFSELSEQHPRLKGVIHAAAVVDDALLQNTTPEQVDRVMRAKATSAWLLHEATLGLELDFFVLFSSATAVLGNPGQGAYVAANSYLEALAEHRRDIGLPALAVGWSAIEDAGYLARNPEVREHLVSRMGSTPLNSQVALIALGRLLGEQSNASLVGDINWNRVARSLPIISTSMFAGVSAQRSDPEGQFGHAVRARIRELPLEEGNKYVQRVVARALSDVLHTSAEDLDLEVSVLELGLDSLMGMELGAVLEDELDVELPLLMLSEGASIKRIAAELARRIRADIGTDSHEDTPATSHVSSESQHLISQHGNDIATEEIAEIERAVNDAPATSTLLP